MNDIIDKIKAGWTIIALVATLVLMLSVVFYGGKLFGGC